MSKREQFDYFKQADGRWVETHKPILDPIGEARRVKETLKELRGKLSPNRKSLFSKQLLDAGYAQFKHSIRQSPHPLISPNMLMLLDYVVNKTQPQTIDMDPISNQDENLVRGLFETLLDSISTYRDRIITLLNSDLGNRMYEPKKLTGIIHKLSHG